MLDEEDGWGDWGSDRDNDDDDSSEEESSRWADDEGLDEMFDQLYHRHLNHAKAREEKLARLAKEHDKEWGKQTKLKEMRKSQEKMRQKYNITAGYSTSDVQTKGYSING